MIFTDFLVSLLLKEVMKHKLTVSSCDD